MVKKLKPQPKYPSSHLRLVDDLRKLQASLPSGDVALLHQAIDKLNKLERGRQNLIEQRTALYNQIGDARDSLLNVAKDLGYEEPY